MVIIAMSVLQKFIITGTSILLILPLKVENKKVKHAGKRIKQRPRLIVLISLAWENKQRCIKLMISRQIVTKV